MPGILRRLLGSPHHRAVFNLPSSLSSPEKVGLTDEPCSRCVPGKGGDSPSRGTEREEAHGSRADTTRGATHTHTHTHSEGFQNSKRTAKPLLFAHRPLTAFIWSSLGATGVPSCSLNPPFAPNHARVFFQASEHLGKRSDAKHFRLDFPVL